MADVRSSRTDIRRFDQLYRRAHHFMGHFTRSVSQNFRASLCPADIQEPVPIFPDAQAQTVARGCGGECAPRSNRNPMSSFLSKDWLPSKYLPRIEDRVIELKQARDLHGAPSRSDLHLVPNAGHMVTYAATATIAQAISSLGTANLRSIFSDRQEKGTRRKPGGKQGRDQSGR
jgi:hypothetical protein